MSLTQKQDFDKCKGFLLVTQCYILTAAMQKLGMDSLQDLPSEESVVSNVWTLPYY